MFFSKSTFSLMRIYRATRYSLKGLLALWKTEAAFRQEVLLSVFLIPAAFWIGQDSFDRILLIGSILLVLMIEAINSAIEALVDRISAEIHPLSAKIKDIGSAAVFIALVNVGMVWGFILIDRWF